MSLFLAIIPCIIHELIIFVRNILRLKHEQIIDIPQYVKIFILLDKLISSFYNLLLYIHLQDSLYLF